MPPYNLAQLVSGTPPQIHMYIQFISDVFSPRRLPSYDKQGNKSLVWGPDFYTRIWNELDKYAKCLGYDINIDLRPNNSSLQLYGTNCTTFRAPNLVNPFHPNNLNLLPPPAFFPDTWQRRDLSGNPIPSAPTLPVIRLFIGDGESLNLDVVGNNADQSFDSAQRIEDNRRNGFAQVIPAYRDKYISRTSFVVPTLRTGYLFTDSPEQVETVFMHELGHLLGLSDRYIEGVVESSIADNVFSFVGSPGRETPPLTRQQVNAVLGSSGPDNDYDPQNNLMCSGSYVLSTYQRTIIAGNTPESAYVNDDVVVLLSLNPQAKRNPASIPPDKPNPSDPTACRKTESQYYPCTVSVVPTTGLDRATFTRADNTIGQHNAFFRAPPGSLLPVRYDGSQGVWRQLIRGFSLPGGSMMMMSLNGFATLNYIYEQLKIS